MIGEVDMIWVVFGLCLCVDEYEMVEFNGYCNLVWLVVKGCLLLGVFYVFFYVVDVVFDDFEWGFVICLVSVDGGVFLLWC